MIEIEGLRFRYPGSGCDLLAIEQFLLPVGTRAAVVGRSGCGKTTFLNLITGVIKPKAGRIVVAGRVLEDLSETERRDLRIAEIGLISQEFDLFDYLPVGENLILPYLVNRSMKLSDDVRDRRVELSRRLGIEDKLGKYPRELSQGERQRVAI
ncbi:MAG: ATP-binding cassette domain-containing protein, partial [Verrucomicrobiota bacterium]